MKKALLVLIALFGILLIGCSGHKHTFSDEWTSDETYHWHPATCEHTDEQDGKAEHQFGKDGKCITCGREHAHTELTFVPEVPATCTEAGVAAYYKCSCGKLFDKESGGKEVQLSELAIDPKGHDKELIHHGSEVGTCVKKAVKEHWECGSCHTLFGDSAGNNVITADEAEGELDPNNHAHPLVEVEAKDSTCSVRGNNHHWTCKDCGKNYASEAGGDPLDDEDVYLELDPMKHTQILYDEGSSATCETAGVKPHWYCPDCKRNFDDREGNQVIDDPNRLQESALGHDYTGAEYIPNGAKGHHRVCTRSGCGHAEEDSPHNVGENGSCSLCGYSTGHSHEGDSRPLEYVPAVNPTCDEGTADEPNKGEGHEAFYRCPVCNRIFKDRFGIQELDNIVTIPRLAHTMVVKSNENEHYLQCSKCGHDDEASHFSHSYECGICTKGDTTTSPEYYDYFATGCGYENLVAVGNLYFGESEGHYWLRKVTGDATVIHIPETIEVNGKDEDVYGIYVSALAGKSIDELLLPSSLKEIKLGAFFGSTITAIFFGGTREEYEALVVDTQNEPFKNCSEVYIFRAEEPEEGDNEKYYHLDEKGNVVKWQPKSATGGAQLQENGDTYEVVGVEETAYSYVVIPEIYNDKGVTTIKSGAFENCSIDYIIIPKSITTIENGSFENCTATLYFLGGENEWKFDEALENAMSNAKGDYHFDKYVYYFSDTLTDGRYWKYADDEKTPVTKSPKDIVTNGGIKYIINEEQTEYYVLDYLGSGTIAKTADNINELPVKKILKNAFPESKYTRLLIPTTITEVEPTFPEETVVFYAGKSLEDYEAIDGIEDCGLDKAKVYLFTDDEPSEEGQFWYYDENDEPQIYVPPITSYTDENGMTYKLSDDSATIVSFDGAHNTAPVLRLPETIEVGDKTYDVTAIGEGAFTSVDNIQGLIIADSIETIGEKAFYGINCLEWVVFGSGLEHIGDNAFYEYKLDYTKPPYISVTTAFRTEYVNVSGYQRNTLVDVKFYINGDKEYWEKLKDTNVFVDWGKVNGLEHSEYDYGRIKIYYHTDTLPEIGVSEYWYYDSVTSLPTPYANGTREFEGIRYELNAETSHAAVSAVIDAQRTAFKLLDNFDFGGKSYTVTEIMASTFVGNTRVVSVILPTTLTAIGENAFKGCTSLEKLVIGDITQDIDVAATAFEGCTKLELLFEGDKATFDQNTYLQNLIKNFQITPTVHYYAEERPSDNLSDYWYYADTAKTVPNIYSTMLEYEHTASGVKFVCDTETKEAKAVGYVGRDQGTVLVIPSKLDFDGGFTVTAIDDEAFKAETTNASIDPNSPRFSGIILPDTIESIGEEAFKFIGTVIFIVVGSGITSIGQDAFYQCFTNAAKLYFRGDKSEFETFQQDMKQVQNSMQLYYGKAVYYYLENAPEEGDTGNYWHFTDHPQDTKVEEWGAGEFVDTTNGMKYSYSSLTHQATVLGSTSIETDLIIPSKVTIGGAEYTVTEIGLGAFVKGEGDDPLLYTCVVIPSTVTKVASGAFTGQNKIAKLVIGANTEVDDMAFSGAMDYSFAIYFDGTKEQYDEFAKNTKFMTDAKTANKKISLYLFDQKAEESTVDYGLWNYDSDGLPVVTKEPVLPGKMVSYQAENGIVYSYDTATKKAIVNSYKGTDAKVVIPDHIIINGSESCEVTEIADSAFGYSSVYITSITIPDSVTKMGANVFNMQTSLERIVLGKNIKTIGENSFALSRELKPHLKYTPFKGSVYFTGDKVQWDTFVKDVLGTITCTSTSGHGLEKVLDEEDSSSQVYFFATEQPDNNAGRYWHYNTSGEPTLYV